MIRVVVIFVIALGAVIAGIFNRRWTVACSMVVLHIAIAGFILGCISHLATDRRHMASSSNLSSPVRDHGIHASSQNGSYGFQG